MTTTNDKSMTSLVVIGKERKSLHSKKESGNLEIQKGTPDVKRVKRANMMGFRSSFPLRPHGL